MGLKKNGLFVRDEERVHPYQNIFPIYTNASDTSEIFLKIKGKVNGSKLELKLLSKYSLISTPPIYAKMPSIYTSFNALFFGILFFVIVFSTIQYFMVREISYLYYVAYLGVVFLYFLRWFELWHPEFNIFFSLFTEWSSHFETPISILIYITYLLFVYDFLDIGGISSKDKKAVIVTVAILLSYIVIDKIFWIIGGVQLCDFVWFVFQTCLVLVSLVYGIYLVVKKRTVLTKYIICGSIILVICASISEVHSKIIKPENADNVWDISLIYLMIGVIIEITFFSIGLGHKNKLMIENKNKALLIALRSQMNPHFIFNGLNSIKLLIHEGKNSTAIKYLTRFSKLIRYVLFNSDKNLISLADELKMCKIFLQIESLRFKEKFEFEIRIDDAIDVELVDIPPLTVQPHLENAIWHGLLPKENDCKLSLIIANYKNCIKCIIEDNGIGREASEKLRTKNFTNKESFGMRLSADRLRYNNIALNVIDKVDHAQKSLGTKVEIIIPK